MDALIIEAIRQGIPTPARQTADRLGIRHERALMEDA